MSINIITRFFLLYFLNINIDYLLYILYIEIFVLLGGVWPPLAPPMLAVSEPLMTATNLQPYNYIILPSVLVNL